MQVVRFGRFPVVKNEFQLRLCVAAVFVRPLSAVNKYAFIFVVIHTGVANEKLGI